MKNGLRLGLRLGLVVGMGFTVACGHRGSPEPPLPSLPMAPRQPAFRQRGDALQVAAGYQLMTLEGAKLRQPIQPALLVVAPRRPDDVAGWDTPAREREFGRLAEEVRLQPPFVPESVGQVVERVDSVPLGALAPKGPLVLAISLRDKRRLSFPSHRVVFRAAQPALPPLEAFDAKPEETGIRLSWKVPADPRAKLVRIYKSKPGEPEPWQPWKSLPAEQSGALDDEARYGERLVYAATAAQAETTDVAVESEPQRLPAIAYDDVFPPLPPTEVDAVAESGRVRVFWYPGGSKDEASVTVERQVEGDERWVPVGTVAVPESFFEDARVDPAHRYRYRVISTDRTGNKAAPFGPTDWVSPRPPEPEPPPQAAPPPQGQGENP